MRSVRPRILALAAVALLLGVALAAVAVMSVAALPVALVLGDRCLARPATGATPRIR